MTSKVPATSTPDGIMRLADTFCDAKALLTAFELGLFTVLHDEPATEEQIRQRLGLHGRGLSDFLNLLAALGLLERTGGGYRNAAGADRYLVRGEETYVDYYLRRNHTLYQIWGRLAETLRTGKPQSSNDFETILNTPVILAQFINLIDVRTNMLGPLLIESFDWPDSGRVLDVGGARGNLAAQIVKARPQLTGTVFDLPQMAPLFDEMIGQCGLTGKVRFHAGDFFTDELPRADVVIMGHVLHDWDPEQRLMLVEKAFHAVSSGGALMVYDRMLDNESDQQIDRLVMSLSMMLVTEGGSEYPVSELRTNALAAGFISVTDHPLGDHDTLMICRKT